MDFDRNTFTQYIPRLYSCQKTNIPYHIDLPSLYRQISYNYSGIVQDLGIQTIPWTGDDAHTYKLNNSSIPGEGPQILFYKPGTSELEWVLKTEES